MVFFQLETNLLKVIKLIGNKNIYGVAFPVGPYKIRPKFTETNFAYVFFLSFHMEKSLSKHFKAGFIPINTNESLCIACSEKNMRDPNNYPYISILLNDDVSDIIYTQKPGSHEYLMIPRDYGIGLFLHDAHDLILETLYKFNFEASFEKMLNIENSNHISLSKVLPKDYLSKTITTQDSCAFIRKLSKIYTFFTISKAMIDSPFFPKHYNEIWVNYKQYLKILQKQCEQTRNFLEICKISQFAESLAYNTISIAANKAFHMLRNYHYACSHIYITGNVYNDYIIEQIKLGLEESRIPVFLKKSFSPAVLNSRAATQMLLCGYKPREWTNSKIALLEKMPLGPMFSHKN